MSKEQEIHMYGCTVQHILDDMGDTQFHHIYIAGILSDVQEAIACEQHELARQWLNKAKFLIINKCYSQFGG